MSNPTLVSLLTRRAKEQGEHRAYIFLLDGESREASLTYADLDRRARHIAAVLRKTTAHGDRVLLLYPPSLEYVCAFFGCLYAGVIAVPAYPPDPARLERTLPRLQAIVDDARASVVLTTAQILAMTPYVFPLVPALAKLRWTATDEAVTDDTLAPSVDLDGQTLAFLQYTSGSTGDPKGVMLTHGNLMHQAALIRRGFAMNERSIGMGWLPLYHDMGLLGNVLVPLFTGIPCVLMSPIDFLRRPLRWLQAITRYRATTSGGPNFAYDLCVHKISDEERATLDLSSWTLAFNGAEPIRAETLDRFAAAFASCGFDRRAFYPCYGLAEASLMVSGGPHSTGASVLRVDKAALQADRVVVADGGAGADQIADTQLLVASGVPCEGQDVAIVDGKNARRCALGEVGEVWVAGPSVAQGYWGKSADTDEIFGRRLPGEDAAFLRTGDLGFIHDGKLFISGREKDVIVTRGANHYPQDLERTVERCHSALRPGCGAAFTIEHAGAERLVLVHELDRRYAADRRQEPRRDTERRQLAVEPDVAPAQPVEVEPAQIIEKLRREIAVEHGLQVYGVALVKAGSIPKTSSG